MPCGVVMQWVTDALARGSLMLLHEDAHLFALAVSAVHKETKQFFTLYNTLDDKKVYLEKEVRAFVCFLLFFSYSILSLTVDGRRCTYVEVRGQLVGVGSVLTPCELWEQNSGLQA